MASIGSGFAGAGSAPGVHRSSAQATDRQRRGGEKSPAPGPGGYLGYHRERQAQADQPILPDAVPDDGQFDIAVLKTRTLRSWVGVATRILVRSRKPGPQVDTYRARKVEIMEIHCDRAQPVQFDGDTVEPTDRLDLEIDPSSLTLAVPEHHEDHTPPSQARPRLRTDTAVPKWSRS
jgi:hypothetical protein